MAIILHLFSFTLTIGTSLGFEKSKLLPDLLLTWVKQCSSQVRSGQVKVFSGRVERRFTFCALVYFVSTQLCQHSGFILTWPVPRFTFIYNTRVMFKSWRSIKQFMISLKCSLFNCLRLQLSFTFPARLPHKNSIKTFSNTFSVTELVRC